MPGVNPATLILVLDPAALPVMPDGVDVAVHVLTVCPPLFELGVKPTLIVVALTILTLPMVGCNGTPTTVVAGEEADEDGLEPYALVQVAVNV